MKTVDVIVVFSSESIELIRACLEAVVRETQQQFGLIIVNNGSDGPTTSYFNRFIGMHGGRIVRNGIMCGYPPAANQGLQVSTADYCVLLNGDTVVTDGWLGKMIECADSNPKIGIVGPLSNAASWQSVPERTDQAGEWSTNPLPQDCTPNDVAQLVERVSRKEFPQIPFINGFCYLIKREVIDAIGYFNDVAFAEGYGEEDDYCLRAADRGFKMAVADHAYVYHAKTKVYGNERRLALCARSAGILASWYGDDRIKNNIFHIQTNGSLNRCRDKVMWAFNRGELRNV